MARMDLSLPFKPSFFHTCSIFPTCITPGYFSIGVFNNNNILKITIIPSPQILCAIPKCFLKSITFWISHERHHEQSYMTSHLKDIKFPVQGQTTIK